MTTSAVPAGADKKAYAAKREIKIATQDLFINTGRSKSADTMADMLFSELGAQELSQVVRADNVNPALSESGIAAYSPIKDLSNFAEEYSPQNIVKLEGTDVNYFNDFPISLSYHIPDVGNGPNGTTIYIEENGDLAIDLVNIIDDIHYVEVEIFTVEEVIDDTIYVED